MLIHPFIILNRWFYCKKIVIIKNLVSHTHSSFHFLLSRMTSLIVSVKFLATHHCLFPLSPWNHSHHGVNMSSQYENFRVFMAQPKMPRSQ